MKKLYSRSKTWAFTFLFALLSFPMLLNAQWTNIASSNLKRYESPNAVVNGKLYVFTGFDLVEDKTTNPKIHKDTEAYDPETNIWKLLSPMPLPVTHTGVAIVDKTVWFSGGFVGDHPGVATEKVQIYDTETDSWTYGPSLPAQRASGALVRLGRKLHAFGGLLPDRKTNAADHYILNLDNISAGWDSAEPMPDPRCHFSALALEGKIYAVGGTFGHDGTYTDSNLMHVFDPQTNKWTKLANLPSVRSHNEPGSIVHNGKIIIVGGRSGAQLAINNISEYDPEINVWKELEPLPVKLMAPVAKIIGNQLYVTNGGLNSYLNSQSIGRKKRVRTNVLYLYGSMPPSIHDMKLTDAGSTGMSQFKSALSESGFDLIQKKDSEITLNAQLLKQYKVLILGSNNRRFSSGEKKAVHDWVDAGGSIIAWSDAAFGWENGGIDATAGLLSNNDLTSQFGMEFLRDNGMSTFSLRKWNDNHFLNRYNKDNGLEIKAESASPIRTSGKAIVLASLPEGKDVLNSLDGQATSADAAVAIAEIGEGRVLGYFDKNTFWNAGEGTNLNEIDNKIFAQRIALWATGYSHHQKNGVYVNQPIPNQKATSGVPFNFTFNASTFTGSGLTYRSTLSNGNNLPAWLSFNGTTRTFSGTPKDSDAGSLTINVQATSSDGAQNGTTFTLFIENPVSNPGKTIRINAGGNPYTSQSGITYDADNYFSGGKSYTNSKVTSIANTTDDALYFTEHSAITNLEPFTYDVPVDNGTYKVRLHFAEIYFGATGGGKGGSQKRVFSVNIEGGDVELQNFDINAEVGSMTAVIKEYMTTVADGVLTLHFTATVDQPKISAIEIIPEGSSEPEPTNNPPVVANPIPNQKGQVGNSFTYTFPVNTFNDPDVGDQLTYSATLNSGSALPSWLTFNSSTRTFSGTPGSTHSGTISIKVNASDVGGLKAFDVFDLVIAEEPVTQAAIRINAGGGKYTTQSGLIYDADKYFSGGKSYTNSKITSIANTTDDALYFTEHSSMTNLEPFSYNIPVDNGTHKVRLHFAEIYFGATGGGKGGSQKRVFSVNIEGGNVELQNFDINAEVGSMTAVIKEYVTTVADGVLTLNFTATVDQPKISAIEVLPSSATTSALSFSTDASSQTKERNKDSEERYDLSEIAIRIFPNPSGSFINVRINEDLPNIKSIYIFDQLGHFYQVHNSVLMNQVYEINLMDLNLKSGLFYIKITTETRNYISKFIKN